ncbi:stimulus-sensing domain-containing protein [Stakelama sediminis]|uniref:histidine kinase n=1 Tax=Stakelama sediminis TaxID=463200 RepID=A0A840YZB8_9SPHN|nr:stimulus-sensing domain-containing protein [Stakelama sediminis]MBB5718887.1 two-component system sensor histidine kinase ChvG [Stakelama sediminis]
MAPATDSPTSDDRELSLRWSGRISLTARILAVNIFALALLAGGFFYLDSYRTRILDNRVSQSDREVRLIAEALDAAPRKLKNSLVVRMAASTGTRVRVYSDKGTLLEDSQALGLRNFTLQDPDKQPWQMDAARFLDAVIDTVVAARRPPLYREHHGNTGLRWPDVVTAIDTHGTAASVWRAPDRTPVVTAAAALDDGGVVLTTVNARDITQTVRLERYRLSIVLAITVLTSILLSLFLARTIVRPLRRLARAAVRVRLGRAREVVVPRLPSRRDEIGMLARALSDMSQALRARIDATEAFAADVTHEIKNPLASLRSAVEGLANIQDPELQARLIAVIRDDIHRLDRLISDISDASRLDAQLSRAKFEPVDLGALLSALVHQRIERGLPRNLRIRFDRQPEEAIRVLGEGTRLERVFENLIDNAISFSPDRSVITLSAHQDHHWVEIRVEDEGPGVPEAQRESIFRRFHSIRPETEEFGKHSGLGLAIARTIIEGHQGTIAVESREDRQAGARFIVRLPTTGARH